LWRTCSHGFFHDFVLTCELVQSVQRSQQAVNGKRLLHASSPVQASKFAEQFELASGAIFCREQTMMCEAPCCPLINQHQVTTNGMQQQENRR
jgi:hypothetical protein